MGKLEGYSESEKKQTYTNIGLGALKYFILKVDPKKTILFDPKASVDFQGNTGHFIQYTYARIQSILKSNNIDPDSRMPEKLDTKETLIIKQLILYPEIVEQSLQSFSPAIISNYIYELVKRFNSFYQNVSIFGAASKSEMCFRVQLCSVVGETVKKAFELLGIQVPERM